MMRLSSAALLAVIGILAAPTERADAFLSDLDEGDGYDDYSTSRKGGMGMGMGTNAVNGGDVDCNVCGDTPDSKGGRVTGLTFRWDAAVGGTAATISADGVTDVASDLADGDEASFVPSRGYFRADTAFNINGVVVYLHTSCSQPIYRGKHERSGTTSFLYHNFCYLFVFPACFFCRRCPAIQRRRALHCVQRMFLHNRCVTSACRSKPCLSQHPPKQKHLAHNFQFLFCPSFTIKYMMQTGAQHAGMIVTFDGGTLTITGFDSTMRDGEAWSSDECEPPCVVPIIANCLNACPDEDRGNAAASLPPSTCAINCVMACTSLAGANADAITACSDVLGNWEDGEDVAVSVQSVMFENISFSLFSFLYTNHSSCGIYAAQNLLP